MKPWLWWSLVAGCGWGGSGPVAERVEDPRPNVVIVLSDALRAANLELYGYPRSTAPHLTAMAQDAAVFEHAFAHAPGTPDSVSQLMTGRYRPPQLMRTRLFGIAVRDLPGDYPLMPRLFAESGYRTGLVTAHPWFEDSSRLLLHFDQVDLVRDPEHSYAHFDKLLGPATAFIDDTGDEPFFLYLHTMDSHGPNALAPEDADLDVEGLPNGVAAYDSDIRRADRGLQAVLDLLAARDLLNDTIVVFTSDHGEEFGEVSDHHYDKDHGLQVRRPLVEIPLVVRLPDGMGAGRYTAPVGLVDLVPTLFHLAHPDQPLPPSDGVDLSPRLLAGEDDPTPRRVLARSLRWWGMYDEDEELLLDRWSGSSAHFTLARDTHHYPRQVPATAPPDWDAELRERASRHDAAWVGMPQNRALSGVVSLPMPWDLAEGSAVPHFPYVEDDDRWTFAGRELLAFPGEEVGSIRYAMPFVDGTWKVELRPGREAPFNEGATVRIEGGDPIPLDTLGDEGFVLGVHAITDPFELVLTPGPGGVSLTELRLTREDVPGAPEDPELRMALEALGYGVGSPEDE